MTQENRCLLILIPHWGADPLQLYFYYPSLVTNECEPGSPRLDAVFVFTAFSGAAKNVISPLNMLALLIPSPQRLTQNAGD
jgi:hypothetical protein